MLIEFSCLQVYAQNWNKEDSVRLSNILSGKDTVRINPEFQKAIQEGRFIHLEDEPGQHILEAPSELPLLKDFSEYLRADTDTIYKHLDYWSMPPSVYRLYKALADSGLKINNEAYTSSAPLLPKEEVKLGKTPATVAVGARNLYSPHVKDGQRRGTITGSVKIYFSLEDILRTIFWKSERNKKRNRKRDNTWKYYNSMP